MATPSRLLSSPSTRPLTPVGFLARADRGFTILEVMMASIVMAFAITTSITTLQRGFLALDTARNTTLAGQIMQSELERMRLKDWTVVNAYEAGPTTLTLDTIYTSNAAIRDRFVLTRSASDVHTDMKKITFSISWRSSDGRDLNRTYSAYYGKNGLYDFFYNTF